MHCTAYVVPDQVVLCPPPHPSDAPGFCQCCQHHRYTLPLAFFFPFPFFRPRNHFFFSGEQNQAKIQKMIEQEAIDQNYHMAMEEAPEVFARVSMLYIDTEVSNTTATRVVRPRVRAAALVPC